MGRQQSPGKRSHPRLKTPISFYRPRPHQRVSRQRPAAVPSLAPATRSSALRQKPPEAIFPTVARGCTHALCLGTKTQRNARERLKALGFLFKNELAACVM